MSDFRMLDFNKVFIAGRLTRDPELRYLPNGTPVVKVGVAISRKYTKKNGEKCEETCFVTVEAWRGQAEFIAKYFVKGRPIFIEGSLKSRSFEQDGKRRSVIEIDARHVQFMDWDKGTDSGNTGQQADDKHEYQDDDVQF